MSNGLTTGTNIWLIAALVVAIVGLLPAIFRVATGTGPQRLVGLQFASVAGLMIIIALTLAVGQSSYLIVAVVLALLSSAGLLVFTRLLAVDAHAAGGRPGNDQLPNDQLPNDQGGNDHGGNDHD